jgi:hypothetical protein
LSKASDSSAVGATAAEFAAFACELLGSAAQRTNAIETAATTMDFNMLLITTSYRVGYG